LRHKLLEKHANIIDINLYYGLEKEEKNYAAKRYDKKVFENFKGHGIIEKQLFLSY
jgi:hypothetical protein